MKFGTSEETIGWFRDRYLEGNLDIRPPYQRKPVWMARQKSHLVESVLLTLPIPEVFIQRTTSEEGATTYALVDGQQRIRTLLQYVGAESEGDQEEYDKFALDKLDPASEWYQKRFTDLGSDAKKLFFGYKIAIRYLDDADEESTKDMFRRLNSFTVILTAQELRNATYEGPFARLAEHQAEEHADFLAENRIVTAASIRRMGDIELMAELLIGAMHGPQGGAARSIDEYYQIYEDYEEEFPGQRRAKKGVDDAIRFVQTFLGDFRDTRWSNKSDFYSLSVVLSRLSLNKVPAHGREALGEAILDFGHQVEAALDDPEADAASDVRRYIANVQRGANDKARRGERHQILLGLVQDILGEFDLKA
jgi:hypothetical protein